MDLPRILGVLALLAGLVVVALLVRRERATAAVRTRLEEWAGRRGLPVRGRGDGEPLSIVGGEGGRLFTVSFLYGPPSLLYVAVDCAADVEGEIGQPGVVASDEALVSRFTNPAAEHVDRLDDVLRAMHEMATELETRVTARAPPE